MNRCFWLSSLRLSGVTLFFLYRFNRKKLDPLIDFINPKPNHQFWEVAK